MSNDYVIIPDLEVDERVEQQTGLLTKDGKKIVRLPPRAGFISSHAVVYAVKK